MIQVSKGISNPAIIRSCNKEAEAQARFHWIVPSKLYFVQPHDQLADARRS